MARDLDTLLAKVRKSIEESRALIEVTHRMVESSRLLLRGPAAESDSTAPGAEVKEASAESANDTPQEPARETRGATDDPAGGSV